MMKRTGWIFALSAIVVLSSCDDPKEGEALEGEEETYQMDEMQYEPEEEANAEEVSLSPLEEYYDFEKDVALRLQEPAEGATLKPGQVKFNFNVENFELGVPTPDVDEVKLAKSDKGQHIHFIIDNEPYSAHYEPTFTKELTEGRHVILAFPARSYHLSVKDPDAFVVREYTVGNPGNAPAFDMEGEHLFYSRPKGTYTGAEQTERILLDFYLHNVELSEEGYRVQATINDGETFDIIEWAPYIIEGLPMGENTIKLELIGPDGSVVPGPYNSVTRTILLEEA